MAEDILLEEADAKYVKYSLAYSSTKLEATKPCKNILTRVLNFPIKFIAIPISDKIRFYLQIKF